MSMETHSGPRLRAVVVIPTYNEADSIRRMIRHLFDTTLPSIRGWEVHVVVVDGNSPDKTADVVREEQQSHPRLHLIVEPQKQGIGAAYFKGFACAMRELAADVLIEFDGDFQHPPESIPLLLERIEGGADVVMGSRRARGGGYPARWSPWRLFLSRVGGFVARMLLFFPTRAFRQVTDPTTGLRATRVSGFGDRLDFSAFRTRGFAYKIEMLYRLVRLGARIDEIPLVFQVRTAGESKITAQTPREILGTALWLRAHDEATRRFVRFGLVGFSGFVVNAVALEAFARTRLMVPLAQWLGAAAAPLGIAKQASAWSAALAAECAIVNNFVWNNAWTFAGRRRGGWRAVAARFFKFNFTSIGAILLQFICVGAATLLAGDTTLVRQAALVLTVLLVIVPYNWLVYNRIIWKKGV